MLNIFRKRSIPEIDPMKQMYDEFWRVTKEIEAVRKLYGDTNNAYIDYLVHDLNAKMSYRDVLLNEMRALKDVDWSKYSTLGHLEQAA